MQLVGEDENANIGYQVVASDIHIEVGRRYHLVVQVSSARHTVTFTVRDLEAPSAAVRTAVVPMDRLTKLSQGTSPIVLGGLSKRTPTRQWDGQIEALRIVAGPTTDSTFNIDPEKWNTGFFIWRAADPPNSQFAWQGADTQTEQEDDPALKAMTGLCQMLLTTNQFFYLH
jgi:hypothetical protein